MVLLLPRCHSPQPTRPVLDGIGLNYRGGHLPPQIAAPPAPDGHPQQATRAVLDLIHLNYWGLRVTREAVGPLLAEPSPKDLFSMD